MGVEPLLQVTDLVKNFGAMTVSAGINLDLVRGEAHALIGPNGAGKTTLLAQLSGELQPDGGSIHFAGRDVTGLPTAKRSRLGLARLYQITSVLQGFTAEDNVLMALQSRRGHNFRFWRKARRQDRLLERGRELLSRVGLADRIGTVAANLSYGEQRQLEVAMVLATEPTLLLLDEPTAGMGPQEAGEMVELLKQIKGRHTMLLVEHDMEAVYALADRISVLVYGQVIATGDVDEIRSNWEVRKAYLGDDEPEGWDAAAG